MTIDNVFGVILQLFWSPISIKPDGLPADAYVLFGAPICAALFILIPWMKALWMLMAVVILFNFIMSIWRAPMIALMPDLTPDPLRSQANGLINPHGRPGCHHGVSSGQIAHSYGRGAVFLMGSLVMISAVVILYFTIKKIGNPACWQSDQLAVISRRQVKPGQAPLRAWFGRVQ